MDSDKKRYNDFNRYLRSRYGTKVLRISLDAGMGCPNRENGRTGCIYCLNGSASPSADRTAGVEEQIRAQIASARSKARHEVLFIAYFQAYTNTYASAGRLFEVFSKVRGFPEIAAVAIGTRPDCVDRKKLSAIRDAVQGRDVWIEYGLQSIRTKTLSFIRRGHGVRAFSDAVAMTRKAEFKAGAHVILGFPWETRKDILNLARFLGQCRIDFLKVHLLHVLRGTPLEKLYRQKRIPLPTMAQYAGMAADLLENIPRSVIIQRLTGEGTLRTHLAPRWALDKNRVIEAVNSELEKRCSFQGRLSAF